MQYPLKMLAGIVSPRRGTRLSCYPRAQGVAQFARDNGGGTLKRFFTRGRLLSFIVLALTLFSLVGAALTSFLLPARPAQAAKASVTNPVPFGVQLSFDFVDMVKQSARLGDC